LLRRYGANKDVKSEDDRTPKQLATEKGYNEIATLL